jgi:hypothetical protein
MAHSLGFVPHDLEEMPRSLSSGWREGAFASCFLAFGRRRGWGMARWLLSARREGEGM